MAQVDAVGSSQDCGDLGPRVEVLGPGFGNPPPSFRWTRPLSGQDSIVTLVSEYPSTLPFPLVSAPPVSFIEVIPGSFIFLDLSGFPTDANVVVGQHIGEVVFDGIVQLGGVLGRRIQ